MAFEQDFGEIRDCGNVMLPHIIFLFELDFIFLPSDDGHRFKPRNPNFLAWSQ